MKQKKTKQCEDCERRFSPEGYRAHKRRKDDDNYDSYNSCDFYARYIKHLRKNVILPDWDEMEKRFAAT